MRSAVFEWRIRYCDMRGVHHAVVAAADRDSALRMAQVPPGCALEVRRRLSLRTGCGLLRAKAPTLKLQLLLLNQIAALLASGESGKLNQVLQSTPALRRLCAHSGDALREDLALSEKLAALRCADEVVASVAAGERTGTLPEALRIAGDYLRQSISLREGSSSALFFGAVLFIVSIAVFFTLPSFLREPLDMLLTTEGITVQTTPATSILLGINRLGDYAFVWLPGLIVPVALLWFFRMRLKRCPPFHIIWSWYAIRRSLRFLSAWRPMRLANIPLTDCQPIFTRVLGAPYAKEFFDRLQSGESLTTILKSDCFSPVLAMSSRGLVESDDKAFSQTAEVLVSLLLEEQRIMSRRLSTFFYGTGILFTVGVVVMIALGLIFPILGATTAL